MRWRHRHRLEKVNSETHVLRLSIRVSFYYPGSEAWVEISAFFLFLFFPRSVTNRRLVSNAHASPVHAYSTWNLQRLSSWKGTDSMISGAMKSHTNEHTVRSRPALKDVKRFRNGSVCIPNERSVYERRFCVNLSRIMLDQRSYQPRLSTLQLDKKADSEAPSYF